MKYIIDVPNQDYSYDKTLHTLKLKFYDDKLSCEVFLDAEPYTEPDRKAIEDEVWEFADNIHGMIIVDKMSCFGFAMTSAVTSNLSYQEAKAKYEAWLKQKDEIHVGDEVVDKNGYKGIATYIKCELCDVLWDDGSVTEDINKKDFSKTGRHFPEVVEMLEKMKGEEE